jgi:hypothetical protein
MMGIGFPRVIPEDNVGRRIGEQTRHGFFEFGPGDANDFISDEVSEMVYTGDTEDDPEFFRQSHGFSVPSPFPFDGEGVVFCQASSLVDRLRRPVETPTRIVGL